MKAHCEEKFFKITQKSKIGDYGFCLLCHADIQRFHSDKKIRHYKSHKYFHIAGQKIG